MTNRVTIFEMSPRDGLQNEARAIDTSAKVRLIDLLSETGLSKIEAASFVNPKAVPQMADGAAVMADIARKEGVAYTALTPNLRGYTAARDAKVDEVAVFASASEGFSKANINCTIAESFERFAPIMEIAKTDSMPVRGYISCVTHCPYDGPVPAESVAKVAAKLMAMGCYEVSLGDTIGAGTAAETDAMLRAVLSVVPADKLAGHFHDTQGLALENIAVSLEAGLRTFDASAGGLGGCPFAPGAKGNVATEAVVEMLEGKGYVTGVDANKLATAATFAQSLRSN